MSIPTGALARALRDLDKSMRNSLDGTKIEQIKDAIGNYAIAAAVASGVPGVAPGIAGVAAALTQAGFVWATYVKINQTLDISMSENTAKFVGSAVVTNLVTGAGAFVAVLVGSSLLSFIPVAGQSIAVAMNAAMGWVVTLARRWRARRWPMQYRHTGSSMRRKGIARLRSWGPARRRLVLLSRRRER